jgi:hypothetical protein
VGFNGLITDHNYAGFGLNPLGEAKFSSGTNGLYYSACSGIL